MFQEALKNTLRHEGFYAFTDGDKGGETYRGIARNFHPNWEGWKIVDREKATKGGRLPWNHKIESPELDSMVSRYYYLRFWKRIMLDKVRDPNLQAFIFDFYVNSGGSGIKVVQRALRDLFNKDIAIDGAMGSRTVAAINSCPPESLFNALKQARINFFQAIAKKGKNAKFLRGWLKRANSFNYVGVSISIIGVLLVATIGFFALKNLNT